MVFSAFGNGDRCLFSCFIIIEIRQPLGSLERGQLLKDLDVDPDKEYDAGTPFFLVASLSSIVVEGTVFESDIKKLKENQPVKVFLDPQSRKGVDAKLDKVPLTPGEEPGKYDIRIIFDVPPMHLGQMR